MNRHGREMHHYLKLGKMLVSLDLCILNEERNDGWFQDRHRQETVALLQDVVADRIGDFYAKKRAARVKRDEKEGNPKAEQPKMLQGNTVKIGFKFTKKPVTQRCLLMKPKFETVILFPEKLHVYVCEHHPSTVLQTTAHLLHTVYRDADPTAVGMSDYFPSAAHAGARSMAKVTTSARKKRNKLKRIVNRQINAMPTKKEQPTTERGRDTLSEAASRRACHQGPLRSTGEHVTEIEDLGSDGIQLVEEKADCDPKASEEHTTKDDEILRSGRHSNLTTGASIQEQAKKRKRNRDWDQKEVTCSRQAPSHTASSASDTKTWEPTKRQRAGDAVRGASIVNLKAMQNRGGQSNLKNGNQELDVVPSDEDAVARSHKATDIEKVDLGDEMVDLCADEVFSDGDVDCISNIISDAEGVSKLSCLHLQRLTRKNRRYLKEIFIGKRPCKRHANYKQGGSTRANLAYEAWYGPYTEDQVDCVMNELVKVYCSSHNKYFDYVSKVLLPEALTKICMDVLHIPLEEAQAILEKTPLCGDATMLGSRYRGGVAH
ncbi:uncharacterized protein LOC110981380 [Acanthaster planci]|uniref:Uncharacterized protein LOC110981380 n=1 Tax=Acanthaster planci TaxID=133434 RepID=A0A8B7YPK6_ACAPL|nr:uncharacterized protein LOC110981380 [Acanthaster planci]